MSVNTGYKKFLNRRRLINGTPDGYIEPNLQGVGLGPYFPPVYDISFCPLPTVTPTPSPTQTPFISPSPTPSVSITPSITPSISSSPTPTPSPLPPNISVDNLSDTFTPFYIALNGGYLFTETVENTIRYGYSSSIPFVSGSIYFQATGTLSTATLNGINADVLSGSTATWNSISVPTTMSIEFTN